MCSIPERAVALAVIYPHSGRLESVAFLFITEVAGLRTSGPRPVLFSSFVQG